jgi:hypothetical protein
MLSWNGTRLLNNFYVCQKQVQPVLGKWPKTNGSDLPNSAVAMKPGNFSKKHTRKQNKSQQNFREGRLWVMNSSTDHLLSDWHRKISRREKLDSGYSWKQASFVVNIFDWRVISYGTLSLARLRQYTVRDCFIYYDIGSSLTRFTLISEPPGHN